MQIRSAGVSAGAFASGIATDRFYGADGDSVSGRPNPLEKRHFAR